MSCRLKNLVQTDMVQVQSCTCGLVHLHFGHFSMRIPENDLGALGEALKQAETVRQQGEEEKVVRNRFAKKYVFRVE